MNPLGFVADLGRRNNRLRGISPVFPEIHEEWTTSVYNEDKEVALSTWVPFEHEGKRYQRHCVEVGIIYGGYSVRQVYDRIRESANLIKLLATPFQESDEHPELNILCDKVIENQP